MRCAALLADLSRHFKSELLARDGSGLAVEAYPDAALRMWLPDLFWATRGQAGYKGKGQAAHERRETILAAILKALGPRFEMSPEMRDERAMGKAESNAVRQFQGWIDASPRATRPTRTEPQHHRLLVQRGDTAWVFRVDDSDPQGAFATADEAERAAKAYVHDRRWNAVVETRVAEFVGGPFGLASSGPTAGHDAEPDA
jgi:hypothetical protein